MAQVKQIAEALTSLNAGTLDQADMTQKGGRLGHRWTNEDEAFIRIHHESMTDMEMATVLSRSRVSVMMRRLKILQLRKKADLPRWTPEDDVMLSELYGEVDTDFLAVLLSRPVATLRSRATRLNIQNRGAWSHEEDEILRSHFPCAPVSKFVALLPGRSGSNIYHRARVLRLSRGLPYLLSSWQMRFHTYPPELKSLIRLHNQVQRKLQDVQAQH